MFNFIAETRITRTKLIAPALGFLHGVFLVLIVVLYSMSSYEDALYDQLVNKFTETSMSQQEMALSLLSESHMLLNSRHKLFSGDDYIGMRDSLFRSADVQLIDARFSCGSYSHVLGRLLQRAGFEIRLAQMKCDNVWGCHIVLEAKVDDRFVSLDSLYNVAFIRSDGKLASFSEVGENWSDYKRQLPSGYPDWFAYEDVRYTNWSKIPLLMPAAKNLLSVFIGDKVNRVSVRSLVLNVYKAYLYILMTGYLMLIFFNIYVLVWRRGSRG
ncbi:MAG: hypothetical protein ACI854_000705 [Arenicella sp.]|jgi:hypothetical protein